MLPTPRLPLSAAPDRHTQAGGPFAESTLTVAGELGRVGKYHIRKELGRGGMGTVSFVGSAITEAAIPTMSGWKTMIFLDVRKTKLTADGIKKLAAKLPGCRIEWDGGVIEEREM